MRWWTTQWTRSRQDDNDLDLLELKENPHRRVQTSGTTGMTNDTTNAFLMQQEPPQEGTNLQNERDDKHVPDATNVFPMRRTRSWRDENPHRRAQTSGMSRTMNVFPDKTTMIQTFWNLKKTPIWGHEPHEPPLPAHPHPSVNMIWFSTRIFLPYILFGLPWFGVRVQPFCCH